MKTEDRLLRLPEVLERVQIEEFSQTFDYELKDITKLDDFNQVVDWENSSFQQESNYLSISMN
tara:strand:- start:280 stop:468 length:189 start_codon:yes stop_codon:yes gene_type:complete